MTKEVIRGKLDKFNMLKSPSRILLLYDELLVKTAVPKGSHLHGFKIDEAAPVK